MEQRCRTCGTPSRRLEVAGHGGCFLFLPLRPEFEAAFGDDFDWDADPRWLCRFIDALACPACGACDLAVTDLATYLECDGPHLPAPSGECPACGSGCHGPLAFACYAVPGEPLAHLAPNYGAPLVGGLCVGCGRVWLGLYPGDTEGRREAAARLPDGGPCGRCGRGRLRATRVDVPHDGPGALFDSAGASGQDGASARVADLLVAVCDACGVATTRAGWLVHKHAEPGAAPDRRGM